MRICETNVNWIYPKITEFRKKIIGLEDELKEHFLPTTLLPVPEEFQDEVPRLFAPSKGGHSQVDMALTVTSFRTRYDGEYIYRWDLCQKYIQERCGCINSLLENMTNNNLSFVGLITNLKYDTPDEDGLDLLKNSLIRNNGETLGLIRDMVCRLTYVVKNRYYVNISLQNQKQYQANTDNTTFGKPVNNCIGITLDVNDRYMSQTQTSYKSNAEAFGNVLQISADIINSKLEEIIRKGEFTYGLE